MQRAVAVAAKRPTQHLDRPSQLAATLAAATETPFFPILPIFSQDWTRENTALWAIVVGNGGGCAGGDSAVAIITAHNYARLFAPYTGLHKHVKKYAYLRKHGKEKLI